MVPARRIPLGFLDGAPVESKRGQPSIGHKRITLTSFFVRCPFHGGKIVREKSLHLFTVQFTGSREVSLNRGLLSLCTPKRLNYGRKLTPQSFAYIDSSISLRYRMSPEYRPRWSSSSLCETNSDRDCGPFLMPSGCFASTSFDFQGLMSNYGRSSSRGTYLSGEHDRKVVKQTLAELVIVGPILLKAFHRGCHVCHRQCSASHKKTTTNKARSHRYPCQPGVPCKGWQQRLAVS